MSDTTVWYYPKSDEIITVDICHITLFAIINWANDSGVYEYSWLSKLGFIKLGEL